MKTVTLGVVSLLAQSGSESLSGPIDLIQFGFIGVALLWFAMGKVHPDSTVKDLREQLAAANKRAEEQLLAANKRTDDESRDAKAVRDAVIKDVVPVMALSGERLKEIAELGERLLVVVLRKEG